MADQPEEQADSEPENASEEVPRPSPASGERGHQPGPGFSLPLSINPFYDAVERVIASRTGFARIIARGAFGPSLTTPLAGTALESFANSLLEARAKSAIWRLASPRLPTLYTEPWHQRLGLVRSLPVPTDLLERLAAVGDSVLPPNLRGIRASRWRRLIEICQEDGISVVWAPRHDIVTGLLDQDSAKARQAYLAEHQDEVLDDVADSLDAVSHPELADWASLLHRGVEAQRAGHWEAAQALAANVLDSAMKGHGRQWLMASFPEVGFNPQAGHYKALKALSGACLDFGELTLFDFVSYLAVIGMCPAFDDTEVDDQVLFNRHLGSHYASYRSYQPGFALPVLLLAHGLLRKLDNDLDADDDEEE